MRQLVLWMRLAWIAPLLIGRGAPVWDAVCVDAAHCTENHPLPDGWNAGGIGEVWFALLRPESRSVYYARLRDVGGFWHLIQALFGVFAKAQVALEISVEDLQPGLYFMHGFATIVSARRIGAHCTISQQVTIGYGSDGAKPDLGDNVSVLPGAKVFGGISVGDNAVIGAGAIVSKDVPPGATVAGNPARVIRQSRAAA